MSNPNMKSQDITHKIIGAAYQVFNKLGFGFLESVYKNAMIIELHKTDLKVEEEKPLKVHYDDHVVGDFYVDLYVEDEIVVELKSVQRLAKEHEVQLVNYLNGIKKDVGMLINFGPSGVQVKRKYRRPNTEMEENPESSL
jgi:GxxExxY protein